MLFMYHLFHFFLKRFNENNNALRQQFLVLESPQHCMLFIILYVSRMAHITYNDGQQDAQVSSTFTKHKKAKHGLLRNLSLHFLYINHEMKPILILCCYKTKINTQALDHLIVRMHMIAQTPLIYSSMHTYTPAILLIWEISSYAKSQNSYCIGALLIQELNVFSAHTETFIVSMAVLFEPGSFLSVRVNVALEGTA